MSDNDDFVTRFKFLIDRLAGGNQTEFARVLGIQSSYVNRWVKQGNLPSTEHLANIVDRLGVNINWLLTGKGSWYRDDRPAKLKGELAYGDEVEVLLNYRRLTEDHKKQIRDILTVYRQVKDSTARPVGTD